EGDEGQVDRVQHQLDTHEHDEHIAADEETDRADPEQHGGQRQVPGTGDSHNFVASSCSSRLRSPATRVGLRTRMTAPITAITRSTEVISKGNRYRVKMDWPSLTMLSPLPDSWPDVLWAPVAQFCSRAMLTTSIMTTRPRMIAVGRCPRRGSLAILS